MRRVPFPCRLSSGHQPGGTWSPAPGSGKGSIWRSLHSLKLTWKLPEGLCKWNQVFQTAPGSFHASLGEGRSLSPCPLSNHGSGQGGLCNRISKCLRSMIIIGKSVSCHNQSPARKGRDSPKCNHVPPVQFLTLGRALQCQV